MTAERQGRKPVFPSAVVFMTKPGEQLREGLVQEHGPEPGAQSGADAIGELTRSAGKALALTAFLMAAAAGSL
jgi:hypothetical protein